MYLNPEFLQSDSLIHVMRRLDSMGGNSFLVGGCVRDAVIGLPGNDIDIATSLYPSMVEMAFKNDDSVKLLPTGIDHGTWTIVVGDDSYEITTFRKDVATDGRRATISYAVSPYEDAQRRDFTMNALYMSWRGQIEDPTGSGIADLLARRVRFVGDAEERCREDHLRIMRLFRFHAHYGKGQMDSDAFWAAVNTRDGLDQISGERKWWELKKILAAHDPVDALVMMERAGVLEKVLPQHRSPMGVANLVAAERYGSLAPKWERRLVALTAPGTLPFPVSRAEQAYFDALHEHQMLGLAAANTAYKTKSGQIAFDCFVLATGNGGIPFDPPHKQIEFGLKQACPVTAQDLMDRGYTGKWLGAKLKRADRLFMASRFTADKEQLLTEIDA